jgi:sugar/nucleoside kinase (ribokinase family)
VGLGNALVDVLVRIDDDGLLDALGVARGRMTPVDDVRWQEVYTTVSQRAVSSVEIQSGGSCANTLATLGLLGARSTYAGHVGRDDFGEKYANAMADACGGHTLQWTQSHPTGKCLSIISTRDAERTMLTDLGAAVHMADLGDFDEAIRQSGLLHLTGYLFLGDPMATRAMEAIAVANQEEIPVSLDLADPFVVDLARDTLWHVLEEFVDVAFLNEVEAETLLGGSDEAAAAKLGEHVDTVVIKHGVRGSLVWHKGEVTKIGVHKVEAIDTTGAGDAYAAGFLYGFVRGWSMSAAGDLGARVAARTVGQLGAVFRNRDALAADRTVARGEG